MVNNQLVNILTGISEFVSLRYFEYYTLVRVCGSYRPKRMGICILHHNDLEVIVNKVINISNDVWVR